MYEKIKKIIPKNLIKNNQELLRNLISIFYLGNKYQCNICDFKMSHFVKLKNGNKLCPKCGSIDRTRKLWDLLKNKIQGKTVLHFSPSSCLKNKIESLNDIKYETSDYAGEFEAMKKINIESINEPNNKYDLVICYHILEHIKNDVTAMKELNRILKPKGKCIIQTPFKEGEIYENEEVKTDEERLKHFGQKDHLRIYSVKGLIRRLESVGFKTKLKEFKADEKNNYGFKLNEKIIIAEKP